MFSLFVRILSYLLAAIIIIAQGFLPEIASSQDYSVAGYVGFVTEETWFNSISHDTVFADANIIVVAGSWAVSRFWDEKLSIELEGQLGKHFGVQDHWEFNLPIVGLRWHWFPWDKDLDTSFAWGIGPSYATRVPEVEVEISDDSEQWLIYWFGELSFGPPAAHWEVLFRIHHRSGGFGLVAEKGGSNTLCAGFRYRF